MPSDFVVPLHRDSGKSPLNIAKAKKTTTFFVSQWKRCNFAGGNGCDNYKSKQNQNNEVL